MIDTNCIDIKVESERKQHLTLLSADLHARTHTISAYAGPTDAVDVEASERLSVSGYLALRASVHHIGRISKRSCA